MTFEIWNKLSLPLNAIFVGKLDGKKLRAFNNEGTQVICGKVSVGWRVEEDEGEEEEELEAMKVY